MIIINPLPWPFSERRGAEDYIIKYGNEKFIELHRGQKRV